MVRFGFAIACAIVLLTNAATAQPPDAFEYRVLLDTDANPATGCGVPVKDANIDTTVDGVDHLVIIHVERTTPQAAQVVAVGRRACAAGSLGPELPVHSGDWPVGLDDGVGGADVVEGLVQLNVLGDADGLAQVAFSSTRVGGNSDVLLTRNGQPGADPLLFNFRLGQAAPAPAMAPWSVALAVLLMSLIAYGALRRRSRLARVGMVALILLIGGIVVAQVATINPDGAVDDWGAIAAMGSDVIHDSSDGDDAEDIVAAFMAKNDSTAYFRFDLLNIIDPAPPRTGTATNTATSTRTLAPMGPSNTATATASATPSATSSGTPSATVTHTPTSTPTNTPVDCAVAAPDTPCDDGFKCTSGETCQGGMCTGGGPVVCIPPLIPVPCRSSAGSCNPDTGQCVFPPLANGTTCNDSSACTNPDTCVDGVCTGTPAVNCNLVIVPLTQCGTSIADCNPANGQCEQRPKPNGTGCDDFNACTNPDTCVDGVCTGTTAVNCNLVIVPVTQCGFSIADCNPANGQCEQRPKPNGTGCDDFNACTGADTCINGVCTGAPVICPATLPTQCNVAASDCNPANGQCFPRPVLNGTGCDDGNTCTSSDSCQSGVCAGTPCPEGSQCCSQQTGCVDLTTNNAHCGACGNACMNSVCHQGQCFDGCVIGGVAYTNGTRNPANNCQQCVTATSRTAWTNLGNGTTEFPVCSVGCFSGICAFGNCMPTGGGPVGGSGACPSRPCQTGTCQGSSCVYTATNLNGACTQDIVGNVCQSTTGTCNALGQCIGVPVNEGGSCRPSTSVDDADCVTLSGTCQSGECKGTNRPNGTVCHGGQTLCHVGTCQDGQCGNVQSKTCPLPSHCNSVGTCNQSTGQCVYLPPSSPPSSGTVNCDTNFQLDQSKCCPGQVCACAPIPGSAGFPQFCFEHECWDPSAFD